MCVLTLIEGEQEPGNKKDITIIITLLLLPLKNNTNINKNKTIILMVTSAPFLIYLVQEGDNLLHLLKEVQTAKSTLHLEEMEVDL